MRDPLLVTRRHALILSVLASSYDCISRQALAAVPSGMSASQLASENARRFVRSTPAMVGPVVFEGSQEWQLVASVDAPIFTKVASYPVEVMSTDDFRVDASSNYALALYEDDDFGLSVREFREIRGIPTSRSMARTYLDRLPAAGMYANEPTESTGPNCILVFPHSRRPPKVGDIETGYVLTTRPVKKGEALSWCYGDAFRRNYKTGCTSLSGSVDVETPLQ